MHPNHLATSEVCDLLSDIFDTSDWYYECDISYMERYIQFEKVWQEDKFSAKALYLPFYKNGVVVEILS